MHASVQKIFFFLQICLRCPQSAWQPLSLWTSMPTSSTLILRGVQTENPSRRSFFRSNQDNWSVAFFTKKPKNI